MKKVLKITIVILVLLTIVNIINVYNKNKQIALKQYAYTIETTETLSCNKEKILYKSIDNKNIYTYCLDNIIINIGM